MNKKWLKWGIVFLIAGILIDLGYIFISGTIGQKCNGDVCYDIFYSVPFMKHIVTLFIWPAAIIEPSILRIIALAFYYFVVGVVAYWIYYKIRNRNA